MNEVAEEIHSRGLERARRIVDAVRDCPNDTLTPTDVLAAAFQAAGDALHAEADAATEQRKRGHQSLTKDLRNAAGRLVGIAQDLMELSKLDDPNLPASIAEANGHREPYTPATDPVTSDLHTESTGDAINRLTADHDRRAAIAAYLGGETDELPVGPRTLAEARDIMMSDDAGAEGAAQTEPRIAAYLGSETDELPTDSGLSPSEVIRRVAAARQDSEGAAQTEPRTLTEAVDNAIERENARYFDAMTPGMPNPCQPIGCDAGIHLPGCPFAERDDLRCPTCGSPDPRTHPAIGGGGEVTRLCPDSFHLQGGPVEQYDNPSTGDRDTVMLLPELAFADPEPYRGGKMWTPIGADPYSYADLMRPVDPARYPDHWSWSQLTSLEECGVKYRGQRLEDVPQQPQWSLIGGKAFHAVTERFDRAAWQAGGADLLPVAGDDLIKERWRDAFAAEINTTAAETGIEMGETGDNYRAAQGGKEGYTWWLVEGERMLALYIHNRRRLDKVGRDAGQLRKPLELNTAGPIFLDTERVPVIEYAYKRKLDVPTGTLTIEGIIDRAYQCADGSLLVTDLKTGRLPNQTGQLGEYAWTLMDLGARQRGTTIRGNFYDARKGLFTDPVDLLATHPHEEYVFRYGAADAARRLGIFLPHRSTFCAGCSIRWACPVGGA